ncbi:MAG: hypothetical protein AABW80_00575 [Nanoarchaeota archaeon]
MSGKKIGIMGNGFVGDAVAQGFSPGSTGNCQVLIYDKNPEKSINTLIELCQNSEIIFVCVPTPMNADGSINIEIVRGAVKSINENKGNNLPIVVIKSTIVPGTMTKLSKEFPSLKFIFNPEFLTQRSARLDFLTQTRIILGGKKEDATKVAELFKSRFHGAKIIETNFETAELVKYMCNVFFSVKISFANEMKLVCEKVGADWNDLLAGFVSDGRVADAHLSVPGPDGKRGFGGVCFPKDINAFISFAESIGINTNTIKGAWKTNLEVREEKDWENLKGRAVS